MEVVNLIYQVIQGSVATVAIAVILLMVVRFLLNYIDLNPFSRPVIFIRRLTDPLVNPVRRSLVQFGFGPNVAPLVTILLVILAGYFTMLLTRSILGMCAGILLSAERLPEQKSALIAIIGWVLYGLLDIYSLLIFVRIILSWGNIGYGNPVMRFLINVTDPLLVPLRRMLPPLGMFDLSPIVAFILLWLLKSAVSAVLIAGF